MYSYEKKKGDILDRGIKEVDILLRMHQLHQQANKAKGKIISLVGNHEIMNYEGDFRYVSGEWGDGYQPFEVCDYTVDIYIYL